MGGVLKKVSGDGPPRDVHEVRLDYKLYRVGGAGAPAIADTAKANSGGGFNVRSALHLAMSGLGGTGDNGAAAGASGASDDSEAVIRQTVDTALGSAARGTMDQLQKNKK